MSTITVNDKIEINLVYLCINLRFNESTEKIKIVRSTAAKEDQKKAIQDSIELKKTKMALFVSHIKSGDFEDAFKLK
jgi:hypothetical protein